MKLTLKDGYEINIDNMNNRQNLSQKTSDNEYFNQHIIFTIFNATNNIIFENLLTIIKDNNTDFYLTYGEGNTKISYVGWIITDLSEEITDDHRKITLIAKKIENEA